MRFGNSIGFLGLAIGAGLGVALGTSPAAVAGPDDPIDDTWPYGNGVDGVTLPGYPGPHTFLPDNGEDVTYLHHPDLYADPQDIPEGDEWYTIHQTISTYPILGSYTHDVVTALLDDSASFPHVGTVADFLGLFPIPVLGGIVAAPLIANYYLDDPTLGFADTFKVFSVLDNYYLSDSAGVKDVVGVLGVPFFTLFEFPAADPDAAASDLSDGTQQLLTEFTNAFPGADLF